MKRSEYEKAVAARTKASAALLGQCAPQRECAVAGEDHGYGLEWGLRQDTKTGDKPYVLEARAAGSYSGTPITYKFLARMGEVLQALERWAADEGDWPKARSHKGCGGRFG
jgi:hypothetical protein